MPSALEPASSYIISLDGFRPEFYRDPRFVVPTLRKLAEAGCSAAGVEPVYPSLTYPNHTTLVTGALPRTHGIVSNARFDPTHGPLSEWYWEASWIKVPTLWDRARARGMKVAIVRWPVTVGAPCDWLIPEVFSVGQESSLSSFELVLRTSTPGLIDEIFSQNPAEAARLKDGSVGYGRRDHDYWASVAASYLIRQKNPDLTLVHLIDVDHTQHEFGRESPLLHESLAAADRAIARIVESIDLKRARLAVVGDHGFANFTHFFRINQLLEDHGWCTSGPDWRAVAHVDGGVAAVYVRSEGDRADVLRTLRSHPPEAFRILEREELDQLGAYPQAVCALDPVPGVSLKAGKGKIWESLDRDMGRHGNLSRAGSMDAGLLLVGAGIAAGTQIGRVGIMEIARLFSTWIECAETRVSL